MAAIDEQTFDLILSALTQLQEGQVTLTANVNDGFGKINGRVKKLEQANVKIITLLSAVGTVVGAALTWVAYNWPTVRTFIHEL